MYRCWKTDTHTQNIIFWPKHQRVQSMRPNVHVRSMEGWRRLPWIGVGKTNQKQFGMDDCDCRSRTDGLKMKLLLVVHIQDCLVLPQMHLAWIVWPLSCPKHTCFKSVRIWRNENCSSQRTDIGGDPGSNLNGPCGNTDAQQNSCKNPTSRKTHPKNGKFANIRKFSQWTRIRQAKAEFWTIKTLSNPVEIVSGNSAT